ncbi:MAG: UDP-N-acetylglucosamine--N-acetylmuramyl-(pentapeptide) pyrophosphoryl-undecaprenol N-acetylglucosamine transferase [Phycisphaerales bacterium]
MNRFLFAGGGTGGHIYPALAILEHLHQPHLFLVSTRPIDARILAAASEPFEALPAQPIALRPRALLRFLRSWGPSVRAVRRLIHESRARGESPHLVAMGGFVAAPAVQAARAERVPITLVNLDAVPGKANRWIARRATTIVSSAAMPGFDWPRVPPIVRAAARAGQPPAACRTALGLDPARPTLLVTGGSQGARSINSLLIEIARCEPAALAGWQILHQTGRDEDDTVRAAYSAASVPAIVAPFIDRMAAAWGAADLAVCRSGANTVAEAWANAVPCLFLPYPFHRDQHQRLNAVPLVDAGAVALATDRIDPAANMQDAGQTLIALLRDPARRARMKAAFAALGPADGAARVAAILKAE